jgi:EAL domain-containing protein (putative c-di-GMP-specific phosphodiesterase class I)
LRELEIALNKHDQDLDLFYQPKLNLFTGKIEKAEALIRWNSKKLGFVPPDEFIPIAEKAGLIESVTRWVIRRAVRDVLTWKEQGVVLKLAINLSVHDVSNVDFMKEIYDTLLAAGLSTDALEFEITESDIMTDPDEAIALLTQFRNYGFDLAIDDFGTGYSSLAYLKNMPVSELKIDKSFVLNLSDDQNDQLIVKSIIGLAQQFGLKLVAEGVEDQSALQLLQKWGCHWAQGYFISRPVNLATLLEWLKENEQTKWL